MKADQAALKFLILQLLLKKNKPQTLINAASCGCPERK